jgi:hypothetical protein
MTIAGFLSGVVCEIGMSPLPTLDVAKADEIVSRSLQARVLRSLQGFSTK